MSDDRTVLEAFRDALVDAMASEMSMLRAHREQWEAAAEGVMDKMGVRGAPVIISQALSDCVLFNRQARADLPEVPRSASVEAGEDPVVQVGGVAGADEGDRADRAEGVAP